MRWRDGRRSENVEDMRSVSGPVTTVGGMSGIGRLLPLLIRTKTGRTLLIIGALFYFGAKFLGIDLLQLASAPQAPGTNSGQQLSPPDQESAEFVSVVLADTEQTWHKKFAELNRTYTEPKLVLFRNAVRSACGNAQSAMGPFYCPDDQKLYIDLAFFEDMKNQLGAPGDFAQAYVIAHEVGHHVQTLLGTSHTVQQAQRQASREQANRRSFLMLRNVR
jgi:predicted metalloprotease